MEDNRGTIQAQVLIRSRLPSSERRQRGPYALFECFQSIPCNPCYTSCNMGAVRPMTNINALPEVDYERCTGCGMCVPHCPGLAIFIIDESIGGNEALVKLPYEYLPMPENGDTVSAVDRDGKIVCQAIVDRVQTFKNQTAMITLRLPAEHVHSVRGLHLGFLQESEVFTTVSPMEKNGESIVCRCEDISLEELNAIMADNNLTMSEIKLRSRASMGPCQGRTCVPLILREISAATGKPIGELRAVSVRQPVKPVRIAAFGGLEDI